MRRVFPRLTVNLQSSDFELFGLPQRFAQERSGIDARWKELQREAHPDRFAAQGAAAQRVALQWSVRINEAYQRLKDPLKRAAYLCELAGTPIRAEDNTAMPADFLHEQMAWRESLDDADSRAEVDAVAHDLANARRVAYERLASTLDERRDFTAAAQEVRALMFIERFAADVDDRLVALES